MYRHPQGVVTHDYLKLANNPTLMATLNRVDSHTFESVVFSDVVTKVNRKGKRQNRALVITNEALYNFGSNKYRSIKRRILLVQIEAVLLANDVETMFVLRVRDQYDYHIESQRRMVILQLLDSIYQELSGAPLKRISLESRHIVSTVVTKPQMRALLQSPMILSDGTEPRRKALLHTKQPTPVRPKVLGPVRKLWEIVEAALDPTGLPGSVVLGCDECSEALRRAVGAKGPSSPGEAMRTVATLIFNPEHGRAMVKSLDAKGRTEERAPVFSNHLPLELFAEQVRTLMGCNNQDVRKWAMKSFWKLMQLYLREGFGRNLGLAYVTPRTKKRRIKELDIKSDVKNALREEEHEYDDSDDSDDTDDDDAKKIDRDLDLDSDTMDPIVASYYQFEKPRAAGGGSRLLHYLSTASTDSGNADEETEAQASSNIRPSVTNIQTGNGNTASRLQYKGTSSGYAPDEMSPLPRKATSEELGNAFGYELLRRMVLMHRRSQYRNSIAVQSVRTRLSSYASVTTMSSLGPNHPANQSSRTLNSTASPKKDSGGISKSDCMTLLEIILANMILPNERNHDEAIEPFGRTIKHPELLRPLFAMLALIPVDAQRLEVLKDINLLILRSEANLNAILEQYYWQRLIFPVFQCVPRPKNMRSEFQDLIFKYTANILIMGHTFCFRNTKSRHGPINLLLADTVYEIAAYSGWGQDAIGLTRAILHGLVSQLISSARNWFHVPDAPEWEAVFRVIRMIEIFLFSLPSDDKFWDSPTSPTPTQHRRNDSASFSVQSSVCTTTNDQSYDHRRMPTLDSQFVAEEDLQNHKSLKNTMKSAVWFGKSIKSGFSSSNEAVSIKSVLPPCSVEKSYENAKKYAWMRDLFGKRNEVAQATGAAFDGVNFGSENLKTFRGRKVETADPVQAKKLANSSMDHGIGIHISPESGKCEDLALVQRVIELWRQCGIAGDEEEDEKRLNDIDRSNRKERTRIKLASHLCEGFLAIENLFLEIDRMMENRRKSMTSSQTGGSQHHNLSEAYEDALQCVAKFLRGKKKKRGATQLPFVTNKTNKAAKVIAMKLEESMEQQRRVVHKRKETGNANQHVKLKAKNAAKLVVRDEAPELRRKVSVVEAKRKATIASAKRKATIVARAKAEENLHDPSPTGPQSLPPPLPPSPLRKPALPPTDDGMENQNIVVVSTRPLLQQQMGVSTRKLEMDGVEIPIVNTDEDMQLFSDEIIPAAIACYGCGEAGKNELEMITRHDQSWHLDCFICDFCSKPLLSSGAEDYIHFSVSDVRLFCSQKCRNDILSYYDNAICAGCMCIFSKGDKALESCGKRWHPEHFKCTECQALLGTGQNESYYDHEGWPFCSSCYTNKFMSCHKCGELVADGQDAVEALGHLWHAEHFGCAQCSQTFENGQYFLHGTGDKEQAYCEKHYIELFFPRRPCRKCGQALGYKSSSIGNRHEFSMECVELGGHYYHMNPDCFSCKSCQRPLQNGNLYEHDGWGYCESCFDDKFGIKCAHCAKPICGEMLNVPLRTGDEMDESNPVANFHPECFICSKCDQLIGESKFYMVRDNANGEWKPKCAHHAQEESQGTCSNCEKPILLAEKFFRMSESDEMYHKDCMVCSHPACSESLVDKNDPRKVRYHTGADEKMYCTKHPNGKCADPGCLEAPISSLSPFCINHAESGTVPICATCEKPIISGSIAFALGKQYHPEHFVCTRCNIPFDTGAPFLIIGGQPVHSVCPSGNAKLSNTTTIYDSVQNTDTTANS